MQLHFFMLLNRLDYKTFLRINFLILVLKIVFTLFFQNNFSGYEDWSIARNLVNFGEYSEIRTVGPSAMKLPIYPLFLSFFQYLFGSYAAKLAVVVQHMLFFLVPIGIVKILEIYKLSKIGLIAGFLFLFSPAYLYYSTVLEATTLFIFLCVFWFWTWSGFYINHFSKTGHFVFFGSLTALLFLTQVVVVPIALVLILYLIFKSKFNFKQAFVFGITLFFCYSPWIIRNYVTMHQFIPSKNPYYQNIFVGFTESNAVISELKIFSLKKEEQLFKYRAQVSEKRMEEIYKQELEKNVPTELYLKKAFQNTALLWYVPPRYFYDKDVKIIVFRKMYVLFLNAISLLSMLIIFKNNKKLFAFFTLIFIGFTIPYTIGHASNIRFKLDFEWIQLILIAFFINHLMSIYHKRKPNKF